MFKNKKGQTTLEYILVVTAVIVGLLLFLGPTGLFRTRVQNTVDSVSNGMENMAGRISISRPLSP